MKAVIQRVKFCEVVIDNNVYSKSGEGLLVLLGVVKGDEEKNMRELAEKIINLRIFQDENEKMNLSVQDINGEIMIISQFTLCTDNNKSGNRPSFTNAENPEKAEQMYEEFTKYVKSNFNPEKVKTGKFAADMKINLLNNGPVTIILER